MLLRLEVRVDVDIRRRQRQALFPFEWRLIGLKEWNSEQIEPRLNEMVFCLLKLLFHLFNLLNGNDTTFSNGLAKHNVRDQAVPKGTAYRFHLNCKRKAWKGWENCGIWEWQDSNCYLLAFATGNHFTKSQLLKLGVAAQKCLSRGISSPPHWHQPSR